MQILRLPEVQAKTGLKHSAIYSAVQAGTFPKPIALGAKAKGWIEAEVEAWIKNRMADRDAAAEEARQARRRSSPRAA